MDNSNMIHTVSYDWRCLETPEELDFRAKTAKKLGAATLIYAAFSTFCLYKNLSGVTMPFFGIATLIYMIYGLRQNGVEIKRLSWFYGTVIMSLAVSDFLTGDIETAKLSRCDKRRKEENHKICFFRTFGIGTCCRISYHSSLFGRSCFRQHFRQHDGNAVWCSF